MSSDDLCCGDLLREVARLYVRAQRAAAEGCGTTSTQCQMLIELQRAGPIPPSELGARLGLEKSWVSRAVDTLVAEGLVEKRPNPDDARSLLLVLTGAGKRRCAALDARLDGHAERLMRNLSSDDQAVANQGLAIILRALRDDAGVASRCPVPRVEQSRA